MVLIVQDIESKSLGNFVDLEFVQSVQTPNGRM